MQPSYRVAPEPPASTVVVYRGQPLWSLLLVTAMMLGMVAFMAVMALDFSRTVTLDLSRPDDACTITRTYPILGDVRESHPLSSVRGTQLVVSRGKHGSLSYEVRLTTDGGPIRLSWLQGSRSLRDPQKLLIDAFLVGTAPSLHLVYDTGSGTGLLPLLFSAIPLLVLAFLWRRARVTIDPASRAVRIERSRWPLRGTTESISFGELRAVAVRSYRGRKGGRSHRVVIVLGSGREVPLLGMSSNILGPHVRAAEQIRSALQRAGASVGADG